MTYKEMKAKVEKDYKQAKENNKYVGLRLESKIRKIGEICECSKHNPNRDDDRDFPEFNSKKYNNLPGFDGTSAWDLEQDFEILFMGPYVDWDEEVFFEQEHCYLIAGNEIDNDPDRDYDEIIIKNAEVIKEIF